MTVTVLTRFPTVEDAHEDALRVLKLFRNIPAIADEPVAITIHERKTKDGVGRVTSTTFGYSLECGPIGITCRSITRYKSSYADPGRHVEEFDELTAEDALESLRKFLRERIVHMRRALLIASDVNE